MSKKIVVIDDEESVTNLLKKIFERKGYNVSTINDSEQGLDVVEAEKPDCVLLDIKMPKMDGIEVLAQIKDLPHKTGVIMITGHGDLESAMECMKLGAFDFITKPFDLEFIENLVERCIESNNE